MTQVKDSGSPAQEKDLGLESSFAELPAPVSLGDESYFLVRTKKGDYLLLSTVCPHNGYEVVNWDNCFLCPHHGWRFERTEGVCINGPRAHMYSFPVTVRDGRLFAEMPEV